MLLILHTFYMSYTHIITEYGTAFCTIYNRNYFEKHYNLMPPSSFLSNFFSLTSKRSKKASCGGLRDNGQWRNNLQ